jgi:cell division protein FtsW
MQNTVYDKLLLSVWVLLILIGLTMVASSSVMVSTKYFHTPFHYLIRQFLYLMLALGLVIIVVRTPVETWLNWGGIILLATFIMLTLVLVPGIGRVVNGSRRWLQLGPIGLQASELAKLTIVIYMAGYIFRQKDRLRHSLFCFIKPLILLAFIALLLLNEPDFGATVVITGTTMTMLFVSGVRLRYYVSLSILVAAAFAILAMSSSYRMARLTGFLNPWADQFNTGYQLTQSLIAFGRGGLWGLGLGDGVQKLMYLPEAHTDFLFAILAEEFGLLGITFIMLLYAILMLRGVQIAFRAYQKELFFAAYLAFGLTFWLIWQALINIGVNTGLLPTKGLTLPFLSYGGASLVVNCVAMAIIFRVDYETRIYGRR